MDTCDVDSLRHPYEGLSILPQTFKRLHLIYFREDESFDPSELEEKLGARQLTTAACFMVCFLVIFLVLNVIGSSLTVYEHYFTNQMKQTSLDLKKKYQTNGISKYKQKSLSYGWQESDWLENCKSFFNCFCLLSNGKELLNTDQTNGDILCLHGLRLLSQLGIITCHVSAILVFQITSNFKEHVNVLESWVYHVGTIGIFHFVDTFFVISGLLNAYSFFQNEAKQKRKSWFYFYVHRFMRLTPMNLIILAFYTTILPYVGSSVCWSTYPEKQICSEYWWQNLLYISNLYPLINTCMVWTWSLSSEMQFFVISPLFLITLWRFPKFGYYVLGLFICGSSLTNFLVTYHSNLPNITLHIYAHFKQESLFNAYTKRLYDYFDKLYVMPYARISPYLIGIGIAYQLVNWDQSKQPKMSSVGIKQGWTAVILFLLYVIFGVSRKGPSLTETSLYNAINQICFASAIAWVIYVCVIGQGGSINKFLSSKTLIPLSRLTYCAYLIHPIFIFTYASSLKERVEFSYITIGIITGSIVAVSFIAAFFVYLLFECPFAKIEKLFFNKLIR